MREPNRNRGSIFVTGTDTGVGKTVLSLLLMRFFLMRGRTPFYLKPIQTGCADAHDRDSDARFIYEHVPALAGKDPGDSVVYCFRSPKAPWFASGNEAEAIDPRKIAAYAERKRSVHSHIVLEGAGGLFVPVTEDVLMIDLIAMLNARPILAARAGLGTINHTILAVEALKARRLDPLGIVFIDSGPTETPEQMVAENIEAVERFSGVKVAGTIGRIERWSEPGQECYRPLVRLFGER